MPRIEEIREIRVIRGQKPSRPASNLDYCKRDWNWAFFVENAPSEVSANTMLCLVRQTNYLLDQLLRQLEQAFLKEGGFTERLYQARQQACALPPRPSFRRNRMNQADQAAPPTNPSYPP